MECSLRQRPDVTNERSAILTCIKGGGGRKKDEEPVGDEAEADTHTSSTLLSVCLLLHKILLYFLCHNLGADTKEPIASQLHSRDVDPTASACFKQSSHGIIEQHLNDSVPLPFDVCMKMLVD